MVEKRLNEIINTRNYLNENFYRGRFFEKYANVYDELNLYYCNARIALNHEFAWLWSYDTIVAVFDRASMELLVFGRYSATTYQHIRKFKDWLSENEICYTIERPMERNLELENWYK